MYAFRMKWRFAGAHYHVEWAHLYLIPEDTRISHTVFVVQWTHENKAGSERNQVFNFPSEIAVAVGRMPFPFCVCMFWVSLCTWRHFLAEVMEKWNVSRHQLRFFTFLMRFPSVLLFCHGLIIFFKFKKVSRWSVTTRTKRNSLCDVVKAEELRKHSINKLQGAESFLRSQQVLSQSRKIPHFMEPEGFLPHSQESATSPFSEPDSWTQFYRLARNGGNVVVNSLKVFSSLYMF